MNAIAKMLAVALFLHASYAAAQSCSSVVSEMKHKSALGKKTRLTMMTSQRNGIHTYSGQRPGTAGYEARLLWSAPYMTTATTGGVRGHLQWNIRDNPQASPYYQNFSLRFSEIETLDFFLETTRMHIYNSTWNYWSLVDNLQCSNGVIWGLGDPMYRNDGPALYVFSYSYDP